MRLKLFTTSRNFWPHHDQTLHLYFMKLFKRTVWIEHDGKSGVIMQVYPFGICRVEDLKGSHCDMEMRKAFFQTNRLEWPFLKRHLFGDVWIHNFSWFDYNGSMDDTFENCLWGGRPNKRGPWSIYTSYLEFGWLFKEERQKQFDSDWCNTTEAKDVSMHHAMEFLKNHPDKFK